MITAPPGVRALSQFFKALSDENRLRIVALLAHGELCVCHIESALNLPQPTVSRHLATLRTAGVVVGRRQGSWMHYALVAQVDGFREAHLKTLIEGFADQKTIRKEVERVIQSKGPDSCR